MNTQKTYLIIFTFMEELQQNEIALPSLQFTTAPTCACIDATPIEVEAGDQTVPAGIYKTGGDILLNQLEVDPCSCFLVACYGALADMTGNIPTPALMKQTLARLKADGKFTPWLGWQMTDGAQYACEDFNKAFGTNIQPSAPLPFNEYNAYLALSSGSSFVFVIHYGEKFWNVEQTGNITAISAGMEWNHGHLVRCVKLNTTGNLAGYTEQTKYAENYEWAETYNIVYVQDMFGADRALFGNSLIYFQKK